MFQGVGRVFFTWPASRFDWPVRLQEIRFERCLLISEDLRVVRGLLIVLQMISISSNTARLKSLPCVSSIDFKGFRLCFQCGNKVRDLSIETQSSTVASLAAPQKSLASIAENPWSSNVGTASKDAAKLVPAVRSSGTSKTASQKPVPFSTSLVKFLYV